MERALAGGAVLVTGAAGAFGSATRDALRERGARVVGLDVTAGDHVLTCDVADPASVRAATADALGELGGRLDLLVHFAGVGPAVDAGREPDGDVERALQVNLLGAWRVTAAALPALLAARGRVVFVASLLAGVTMPFAGAYTVSKRALTAYADALRTEYGTHIGVTTVYPGYVDTPIHDRSRAAGVSLDGLVPAEQTRDIVDAVVRAATRRRPPRDLATTRTGTAVLLLARHAPALVERVVGRRVHRLATSGRFAAAPLARGLADRHTAASSAATPQERTTR